MDVSVKKHYNRVYVEGLSEKGKRWVRQNTDSSSTLKDVSIEYYTDILNELQMAGLACELG